MRAYNLTGLKRGYHPPEVVPLDIMAVKTKKTCPLQTWVIL